MNLFNVKKPHGRFWSHRRDYLQNHLKRTITIYHLPDYKFMKKVVVVTEYGLSPRANTFVKFYGKNGEIKKVWTTNLFGLHDALDCGIIPWEYVTAKDNGIVR